MKRILKIATSLCITVLVLLTVASCGFNPLENLFPADTTANEATDATNTDPVNTEPNVPTHQHVFDEWITTKEPNCGTVGERTATCSCGATQVEELRVPMAHSYGAAVVIGEPTCVAAGMSVATCSVCGDTQEGVIPATGNHTYGEAVVSTPATCTKAGETTSTCSVCGDAQKATVPPTGEHIYQQQVCSMCGKKDIPLYESPSVYDADDDGKNEIYYFSPMLPEAYTNATHVGAGSYESGSIVSSTQTAGMTHWYITENSNPAQFMIYSVEVPEAGEYEMIIHVRLKDAQERGTKYTVNGGTDYEQIFQTSFGYTGMDFVKMRDAATESAYMYGITVNLVAGKNTIKLEQSSSCPKSQHYRDFYFIKVGEFHIHSYDEETITQAPTCNTAGEKSLSCACGKTKLVTVPATGEHAYTEETLTQAPGCGSVGIKLISCACGASKNTYIPATGAHNFENGKCIVCGQKDFAGETEPMLCGDPLSSYVIVYADGALDYTVRAAQYIADEIAMRTGVVLPIMSIDSPNAQNAHEIVVGETSRPISQRLNADTEGLQFALLADENHVAMEGDYFIIAAAAYYFIQTYIPGAMFDSEVPQTVNVCTPIVEEANNYILLIGDGMGFNQTKLFDAYADNGLADYGDGENFFYGYLLPYLGEARTNSLSGTTDSAAAGTALSSGYKTINGYVGKDSNKNDVASLTELAAGQGMATAVMSTEVQTGATPSAFSAHANSRHDTDVILASQAAMVEQYGTIINCDYNVYTEAEMVALRAAIIDTLHQLSKDEDGFFMMYEEAYIDKHCHNNRAAEAYLTMVRFNQAIGLFMEYAFYNPDTMVIITADHETGGLQIAANGDFYYTSGSHTPVNVPVFAYGAGCEVFDGQSIENVQIPKTIAAMFGIEIAGTDPTQYPSLVPVDNEI